MALSGFAGNRTTSLFPAIGIGPESPQLCRSGLSTVRAADETTMTDRPTVLVTGGAGYIGSHCIRALAAARCEAVVYDNLSTGHRTFVAGPLVVGDLLNETALAQVFSRYKIAAVIHFAAASVIYTLFLHAAAY